MITMLLGGLWHGAHWKFVFWGAMHGAALVVEKSLSAVIKVPDSVCWRVLRVFLTFHFVCFLWIFFRADSFATAMSVVRHIAADFRLSWVLEFAREYSTTARLIVLGLAFHYTPRNWQRALEHFFENTTVATRILSLSLVMWLIAQIEYADIQPFIYFQF